MPTITISNIAEWAANKRLKRPDILPDVVDEAVNFYYVLCNKVPFEALQYTSSEQSVVAGTAIYSMSSFSPAVAGIVALSMKFSSTSYLRLRRSNVRAYEAMRATPNGRPYSYARWGQDSIEFFPPPNLSTYTWRVRYWCEPTVDSTPGDTIVVYPTAWAELHRWETYYRALCMVGRHEEAQLLVQPSFAQKMPKGMSRTRIQMEEMGIIPRLWNELMKTPSQRESVDEDFGVNPIVRPYTY